MTVNRSIWKKIIRESCKEFEARRPEHFISKQALRKQELTSVPDISQTEDVYYIYSRSVCPKAGQACHMRFHGSKLSKTCFTKVFQQQPTENSCQFCDKVCGSIVDLRSHIKVHEKNVNGKDSSLICQICNRTGKYLA